MLFLACPVEPTLCGAAHSKYCGKREHQCGEDVVIKSCYQGHVSLEI